MSLCVPHGFRSLWFREEGSTGVTTYLVDVNERRKDQRDTSDDYFGPYSLRFAILNSSNSSAERLNLVCKDAVKKL